MITGLLWEIGEIIHESTFRSTSGTKSSTAICYYSCKYWHLAALSSYGFCWWGDCWQGWLMRVPSLTASPQTSSSWPKTSTCMQPGSSGAWSCASCLTLAPLLWSSGTTATRSCVLSTRRISWASQKVCQKLLNIKPTRCNPSGFLCWWGGCDNGEGPIGHTHRTWCITSWHISHTHTYTHSWPHLPNELFRASYFFNEKAQALPYVSKFTLLHWKYMHDRARSLCMITSWSPPPLSMPCSSYPLHVFQTQSPYHSGGGKGKANGTRK